MKIARNAFKIFFNVYKNTKIVIEQHPVYNFLQYTLSLIKIADIYILNVDGLQDKGALAVDSSCKCNYASTILFTTVHGLQDKGPLAVDSSCNSNYASIILFSTKRYEYVVATQETNVTATLLWRLEFTPHPYKLEPLPLFEVGTGLG